MTDRELPTAAQRAVLSFVERFIATEQCPPTRAEIAANFNFASQNAAHDHLVALERKGFVRLKPGRSRGIFVLMTAEDADQLAAALAEQKGGA